MFITFCFCFLAGVGATSVFDLPTHPYPAQAGISVSMFAYYLFISLFSLLFLIIIFWHKKLFRFFIFCLFFLILGVWRFSFTIPDCDNSGQVCFYNDKKVTFTGWVSDEPDVRMAEARYTVDVASIADFVGARYTVPLRVAGKILLKTRLYPEYHYGDELKIECKLQKPENKDDSTFRYDKYLARYGIWSVCENAKIEPARPHPLSLSLEERGNDPFSSKEKVGMRSGSLPPATSADGQDGKWMLWPIKQILRLKSAVQSQVDRLWPEPESSFMAGILYGSKSGLPPELSDNFNRTGVTHIIAVSGYNITIIATSLMSVLIALGLWRRQAFWGVVTSIILFTAFTGFSSSAVRAAVMGIVVLTGQYLGRLSRIGGVLVFTAAVMVAANPYVLMWDAGFQLSFLATLGLVYVSPLLSGVITRRPRADVVIPLLSEQPKSVVRRGIATLVALARNDALIEPLISTLAAIIATLPLILYQFGRLSIVAPLVNVLILWTIPWLMLFGFIALVIGFLFYPFGQLVAWFAGLGLKYVIIIVNFFGNQPWSALEFQIPWWGVVAAYILMISVAYKYSPSPLPTGEGRRVRARHINI